MTALELERDPGREWPGPRPFENQLGDLELVGVQFAPEQVDLLRRGVRHRAGMCDYMYAMALVPMPDPVFANLCLPALTVDPMTIAVEPVLVPQVIEVECSQWQDFDDHAPNWRRFPSLLGRAITYDHLIGESSMEGLDAYRLWNLWPLEQEDVSVVYEANRLWQKTHWEPWINWLEVRDNQGSLACDYEGTPVHLHDHEYDDLGEVRACHDGDHWHNQYRLTEVWADDDGDVYHRPFGPVDGLHELQPAWENLLVSSRANTMAALDAYPFWEREQAARTERHYSPWLWSS